MLQSHNLSYKALVFFSLTILNQQTLQTLSKSIFFMIYYCCDLHYRYAKTKKRSKLRCSKSAPTSLLNLPLWNHQHNFILKNDGLFKLFFLVKNVSNSLFQKIVLNYQQQESSPFWFWHILAHLSILISSIDSWS